MKKFDTSVQKESGVSPTRRIDTLPRLWNHPKTVGHTRWARCLRSQIENRVSPGNFSARVFVT
jgi:hypothetical protein